MTKNPDGKWLRWITRILIGVALLYPLAIGPAASLYVLGLGPQGRWYHQIWLQGFYGPVFRGPLVRPLVKPAVAYIRLWLPADGHANAENGGIIFSRGFSPPPAMTNARPRAAGVAQTEQEPIKIESRKRLRSGD